MSKAALISTTIYFIQSLGKFCFGLLVLNFILVYTKILCMMNELTIIGEPRRQRILQLVWDEELSAGDIASEICEISFGAVSQHLGILVDGKLIKVRREGRRRIYRANRGKMGPLEVYLTAFWGRKLDRLKLHAEQAEREKTTLKGKENE